MDKIDKLTKVSIKDFFKYEAQAFTPWLAENLDYLSDEIGVKLANPSTEQTSENFRVDIHAELEDGSPVVIENQFGDSNHDHLGKIITYRTAFDAKVAIWIVERAKQEHIDACNWLNQTDTGCDFYLIEMKLIRIGDSSLAPIFTVMSAPSVESREKGEIKKEEAKRYRIRYSFWSKLLDVFKADKDLNAFKNINPTTDSFIGAGSGIGGIQWNIWLNKDNSRCELRIDKGKGSEEENIAIFNKLKAYQKEADAVFGPGLKWDEMEGYRLCSIRIDLVGGWNSPEEEWPAIIENVADTMKRLIKALKPCVAKLK